MFQKVRRGLVTGGAAACLLGLVAGSSFAATLPTMRDLTSAPAKIRVAAKAVVKVVSADRSGTGSFISPTGLLLTNNHVLGEKVCAAEGCYVEVTFMRQRGEPRQPPRTVFAKLVAVDAGLDIAVVQLYEQRNGAKLGTPDFLSFNSQTSASLIGRHVTIVGHADGCLKKWTDGRVANAMGKWFRSTNYVLPGDSGSPVLDDDGKIVGIVHRGPSAQDLFSKKGVNEYSISTASASILAALEAPLPERVISISAATTAEKFVANDILYLNARTTSINVNGTQTNPLDLLGNACDAALARTDYSSPDEMREALQPCYDAQYWIDCRYDAQSNIPYLTSCPSASRAAWVSRYENVNKLWVDMNGQIDYYTVSHAIARLEPSRAEGVNAGAAALQKAISAAEPILDPLLASYLAPFDITSYANVDLKSYLVNFKKILHFEQEGSYLVRGAYSLGKYFTLKEFLTFLTRVYNDPNTSLGTKLLIDDIRYQLDAL